MFDAIEYEIPLDYIPNKMKIQTMVDNNVIIMGIFIIVISFLLLIGGSEDFPGIFFTFGMMAVIFPFLKRKKVVSLSMLDGNSIDLYFTNRNKHDVVDFANKIIEASNRYLLKKYTKIDRSLPMEPQIEGLQYLLNREVITEEEFDNLKNQLLGKENLTSIGFTHK